MDTESRKENNYAKNRLTFLQEALADPKVCLVGSSQTLKDLADRLTGGGQVALCIDAQRGELYIGGDHLAMAQGASKGMPGEIPDEYYLGAIIQLDKDKKVSIPALYDWARKIEVNYWGEVKDKKLLDLVQDKLQSVLYNSSKDSL